MADDVTGSEVENITDIKLDGYVSRLLYLEKWLTVNTVTHRWLRMNDC